MLTNKKIVAIVVAAIIICALIAGAIVYSINPTQTPHTPTGALDFTVSGSSDCLRFLNDSVPIVYVPFTIAANENWKLTINATKMPGGANGWTDIYIYKGYWDQGTNHTCKSGNVYSILKDISSADFALRINAPYTGNFGEATQQSYTVFFVFPPGGQAVFHVTLKQA
jgi:hypothetical protein